MVFCILFLICVLRSAVKCSPLLKSFCFETSTAYTSVFSILSLVFLYFPFRWSNLLYFFYFLISILCFVFHICWRKIVWNRWWCGWNGADERVAILGKAEEKWVGGESRDPLIRPMPLRFFNLLYFVFVILYLIFFKRNGSVERVEIQW